ncbi:MAG: twin-arginine translocation signal domain-containing protein [Planctomycetota bacterium]
MPSRKRITRRRFMGATATAAGGMLMPGTSPIVAESQVASMTDHFWYRLQPEGPYIDSQRDNKAFGFDDATIFLSEDNARTWPHSVSFADARNITFSAIMKNGNVIFATGSRLYLSTDNLKTYHPITVKDAGGADYIPHKPQNPELPGWYFHPLDGVHTWDVNGVEMLVWGNYCNVLGGASPVNIYYSVDGGRTVRIAYAFGQNPGYRDNGSEGGGSTGTPLGDPDNPVIARHIHCVAYNPAENAFYACTGDRDRDGKQECHWLRGAYDAGNDKWRWTVLVSGPSNSRYKSGGINFVDGKLYWVADANGPTPHDRGIFRCDPADLARPEAHTMLFNPQYEAANMIIQDGVILSSHYAPASPYSTGFIISPDMGRTWAQYDLKQYGRRSPVRFDKKNGDGWFRVDLRSGWIKRAEVLFIKPKKISRAE